MISVPIGFVILIFLGLRLVPRLQVKHPKMAPRVLVLEVRPHKFRHELVIQADADIFVLTITSLPRNLLEAIKTGGYGLREGPPAKRNFRKVSPELFPHSLLGTGLLSPILGDKT